MYKSGFEHFFSQSETENFIGIVMEVTSLSCSWGEWSEWQGSLLPTLKAARPTIFFGVPRVFEKFQERIEAAVKEQPATRRSLFKWGRTVGLRDGYRMMNKYL